MDEGIGAVFFELFSSLKPQVTPAVKRPAFCPVCISTPLSPTYRHSAGVTPNSSHNKSAALGSGFFGTPSLCPWTTSKSPVNSFSAI